MSLANAIDPILRRAAESGDVPGVVAMAANESGVIYEGGFGKRDLAKPDAMTPDTVVWLASMTKAVTGAAAMQLVERGKVRLEHNAADLVPELANPQVLEGMDGDTPKLRPAKKPITVHHLITHTAGFGYDIWSPLLGQYMQATGTPGIISCSNAALRLPLLFDPGERWNYGINIDWLGKIVEAVHGKKLDRVLAEEIFEPLGMTDIGFKIGPAQRGRLANIHQRGDDGGLTPTGLELEQNPEFHMGGGGLYGTAADYLAFARMLMAGGALNGRRVLKSDTVALMAKNGIGDLSPTVLKTAAPPLSLDADFFPGLPAKWGLSFYINAAPAPTGRSAQSLAWAGLANTYYWIDPVRQLTGVILMQILPFFDTKAIKLFRDFETAVYGATAAKAA
ncbi:MAG TPA: serine hydrolase domain-containing protein [Vineibacter sp.]|nr:serine hydrolase domain-containing protein [Vineibacter sp.]